MDQLEGRQMLTAVTWDGEGDGVNWHDALNWSNNTLPTAGDDVSINVASDPLIKFTATAGTVSLNSLTTDEAITFTGGSLGVVDGLNVSTHTISLAGGKISNTTINLLGGAKLDASASSSNTLDGVTVNGDIDMTLSGSRISTTNGLTLNGTLTLGGSATLTATGTQTITGTGNIIFSGASGAVRVVTGDSIVTLDENITISTVGATGTNYLGFRSSGSGGTQLINLGTIISGTSGATLQIDAASGGVIVNHGTIKAHSGGRINLYDLSVSDGLISSESSAVVTIDSPTAWTNAGTINLDSATLYLDGAITSLGKITRNAGNIYLKGTVDNSDSTFTLDASTGVVKVWGGTIKGGTVNITGGAWLASYNGGTLDGVTINGDVSLNTTSYSEISVINGLTLNGTATFGTGSVLEFVGTQTLTGEANIVFKGDNSSIELGAKGMTLTLDKNVHIRTLASSGAENTIYASSSHSGTLINNGTISAEVSTTLSIRPYNGSFINHGTVLAKDKGKVEVYNLTTSDGLISAVSSGTLTLESDTPWTNAGTINLDNATIDLFGAITGLGKMTRNAGTLNLRGEVDNSGSTFFLDGSTGSMIINSGTISGGTLNLYDGAKLISATTTSSKLDGVTINGDLDIIASNARLTVTNGLTINGTITLASYGYINFVGTQTLQGTGTVLFTGTHCALQIGSKDMTLTLGKDLKILTGAGSTNNAVGYLLGFATQSQGSTLVNYADITSDGSGVTFQIDTYDGTFINHGTLKAINSGSLLIGSLTTGDTGAIQTASNGSITVLDNLASAQTDPAQFQLLGTATFAGQGTALAPQLLEVMSENVGADGEGFTAGFAINTLKLSATTYVKLVDLHDNTPGEDSEALYVNTLVVPSGATLDLNGLDLYTTSNQSLGSVINGTVITIPQVFESVVDTAGYGSLLGIGETDIWTFTGKAGDSLFVIVNPSSGPYPGATGPTVNWVDVQFLDAAGNILAAGKSPEAGGVVNLGPITLPEDGQYRIRVTTPEDHLAATGNYVAGVWTNQAPVAGPVTPRLVGEDIVTSISLHSIFDDAQTPDSWLSYKIVSNSNPDLFTSATISGGSLKLTPALEAIGEASFVVEATDHTGLSTQATIPVTIVPTNDRPTLTVTTPHTIMEDAGPQSVANWTVFNPGPPNEAYQTATYNFLGISNKALFAVLPSIDANGTLTYTPAANAWGSATCTITVTDSGGPDLPGPDTSTAKAFMIIIRSVNDAPSFTTSSLPLGHQDSGPQSVANWAVFNPGAANESAQTATYTVSDVSNSALFSAPLTIDALGTLTYTPAPGAYGVTTFSVQVKDSGGTLDSGIDTSAAQTFTLTIADPEVGPPTVVNLSSFPAPRTTPVLTVGVRMSAMVDMSTFTWEDITLTRDGSDNLATSGITIAMNPGDPKLFTMTLPAALANPVGNYSLTVEGGQIQSVGGTTFSNARTTTWTIIAGTPGAPKLDAASEGKPNSGFTQFTTPTVMGTGSVGSTVEVYEGATLKGSGVVGSDGTYNITLSSLAAGVHTLKSRATDSFGTITSYSADSTITVETANPTIVSMSVYAAPRTVPVGSTGIRFSSQIDLSTFTSADITLTRDGSPVSAAGMTVTVSPTDPKLYTIVIPPALNTPDGVYVLSIAGSGINNLAGKPVTNNFSNTWTVLPQIMNMSAYPAARAVPVTAPGIRFSNPITLATFTWADITLTRNGGGNLATSAIMIVQSGSDPAVYTIVIPSALTNIAGTYVLTVTGGGIQSPNGFTISNNMSTTWTQV